MFDSLRRNTRFFALMLALACLFAVAASAARTQEKTEELPENEGSVTDLANALDSKMTRRLENMLDNLAERSGIELFIVTIKTTGGKDLFEYSQKLANEWDIGAIQSKEKSLLLVVSIDDGKFFTQVSRRARGELPDGLIGEMGNRMRAAFGKGKYAEGLFSGVETFITRLAERHKFSLEGIEQAKEAAPADAPPQRTPTPAERPRQVTAAATPTPTPRAETEAAPQKPAAEVASAKEPAAKEPETKKPAAKEPAKQPATKPSPAKPSLKEVFAKETGGRTIDPVRDVPEKTELDAFVVLPPAERIEKLKAYIEANPRSPLKTKASELLVSAHATLGDEKLRAGDPVGGVEQFQLALSAMPEKMEDAFFLRVVSQLPLNLYLRGQRLAASDASRQIEAKVKDDPKRLLALAGFFLSVEEMDEAARLSGMAIALAPDMASAHQILGAARHIGLRLDDAATEYARALELDPKLAAARRCVADLRRATGKPEAALVLYREQLAIDPADKPARAGIVLSLLDLGKKEEAEREMEAALKDDPNNMALLVGASYWHAAKSDPKRAQELAARAIEIEPRYTWAQIALARALVAQKRPLEAERVLRFVRQYGNFPTLDYELASTLAASGFYDEAAAELARSFVVKDGQIETRLAGRIPARAPDFIELLAPERRAGIFQPSAADTETNARVLKGLLSFHTALSGAEGRAVDAAALSSARADFLAGEDAMRPFRQLYAAGRLLARGRELNTVFELAEAASSGVEAALGEPVAEIAVMADELRDAHARAVASANILPTGVVPRNVLSNILRGRIEDLQGWALFNQDKSTEALVHLRRALSVLPEQSAWWRMAQWHFGAALETTGSRQEALAAYMKAYNPAAPNLVQRAVIEALYRKVNGSLEGLDAKIGAAPSVSTNTGGSAGAPLPSTPDTTPAAPVETQTQPTTTTPTEVTPPASEQPKTEGTEQKPAEQKPPGT